MELSLIKIKYPDGLTSYHAVNDLHYDAMLTCGHLDPKVYGGWDWMGDVTIDEEILNEQGFYWKEEGEAHVVE